MKKPRFRRFGISTGSKVQQANLRTLAKDMAEDPTLLIPGCAGNCSRCPFKKLLARLRKIQAHSGNPDALRKLTSSGKQLERGYACMLLLATEKTPLMFATAKLPTGDVNYTVRGKVRKEILIGLQHFDDPKMRLLAYSEFALKNKLHIYSLDEELLCSGKGPAYPGKLISEVLGKTNYTLKKSQSGFECEHSGEGDGLKVHVKSAGTGIHICRSCSSRKHNLYTELTSRVIARKPENDFEIQIEHNIECIAGEGCTLDAPVPGARDLLVEYRSGQLSDMDLIGKYRSVVVNSVKDNDNVIFVLGNTCYEKDVDAFVKALNPSEIEEAALKRVLKIITEPVIMETATPNAVLTLFWERLGPTAIHAVVGDKDLARKIYAESRDSGKIPSQILRDAKLRLKTEEALGALPRFKGLSAMGRYVDEIARTYKALGRSEALKSLNIAQADTKFKSLNCGLLLALEALKGKEWQFTKEELDYGSYLADYVRAFLDSRPGEYADALRNLLAAAGSDEEVR